jgi:hypothetical protein
MLKERARHSLLGATNPAQMVLAVEKLGVDHFEMLFLP